eukprot:8146560-Heterocapsa_arctica.AAC.1
MRLRLGCHFSAVDRICGACGDKFLDKCCYHASCCAKAESTRGHYAVRDSLARPFAQADASTECETEGLCPSFPTLRPADIFTQAAHCTLQTAVDVMIKSPYAGDAGNDCAKIGKRNRLAQHAHCIPELEDQVTRVFSTPLPSSVSAAATQ